MTEDHGQYDIGLTSRLKRLKKRCRANNRVIRGIIKVARQVKAKTFADFGASYGDYVRVMRERGMQVDGFDWTEGIDELSDGLVVQADLAIPQSFDRSWDIVFSLDVGEHIPAEYEDAFVSNICHHARKAVIVSWGLPGQRGWNHVNCLRPDEVAELFRDQDFVRSDLLTEIAIAKCIHAIRKRLQVFVPAR